MKVKDKIPINRFCIAIMLCKKHHEYPVVNMETGALFPPFDIHIAAADEGSHVCKRGIKICLIGQQHQEEWFFEAWQV